MVSRSFLICIFLWDLAGVIVGIYCGMKSAGDFRAKRLWLGLWGAVCTVVCFVFAVSLWVVPYVP
jgi:hypothetical protein